MYHISDLKRYSKCNRLYYLNLQSENKEFQPYLRSDVSYTELVCKKLNINENSVFMGERGQDASLFLDNINNYEWFVNARVEMAEMRVKIPFLHRTNNGFEIYFCWRGVSVKDLDFFSYKAILDVLTRLNIVVSKAYVIYINAEYVFEKEINPELLFLLTDTYRDEELIDVINNTECNWEEIIKMINAQSLDLCPAHKSRTCHSKNICEFYSLCFPNELEIEDDSILTLVSSQYKNQMYDDGIRLLKDANISQVEGNRVQYAQIMASKNGGLFIDRFALNSFLSLLKTGPTSYIDFEWDRYLIPPYDGMKPLDVIPFEFALYIDDGKQLVHKTFISCGDCREDFIKKLIEYLPDSGAICAYNATGAEVIRLQELAVQFPQYEDSLHQIIDRFVDLAIPFVDGIVYDTKMAGNYSLKKLVSIVSDKSYQDLEVNEGMKAVYSWRDIDNGKAIDTNKVVEDLKQYCSLDAYGLLLVHRWLNSL